MDNLIRRVKSSKLLRPVEEKSRCRKCETLPELFLFQPVFYGIMAAFPSLGVNKQSTNKLVFLANLSLEGKWIVGHLYFHATKAPMLNLMYKLLIKAKITITCKLGICFSLIWTKGINSNSIRYKILRRLKVNEVSRKCFSAWKC